METIRGTIGKGKNLKIKLGTLIMVSEFSIIYRQNSKGIQIEASVQTIVTVIWFKSQSDICNVTDRKLNWFAFRQTWDIENALQLSAPTLFPGTHEKEQPFDSWYSYCCYEMLLCLTNLSSSMTLSGHMILWRLRYSELDGGLVQIDVHSTRHRLSLWKGKKQSLFIRWNDTNRNHIFIWTSQI